MKKLTTVVFLFLGLLANPISGFAEQGAIKFTNKAYKQVMTEDEKGVKNIEFVEPKLAIPGDEIFYEITFENISKENITNIVVRDPIPNNSKYIAGSAKGKDTEITFSVDGTNFASPDKLTVKDKNGKSWPATPKDYKSIRWIYKKSLASGSKSTVSFKTVIREPDTN